MSIGSRIKQRRRELKISAEMLAEKIGVSPATIYRYENGSIMNMGTDKVDAIAEALSIEPKYLMGWEDMPKPVEKNVPVSDYDTYKIGVINTGNVSEMRNKLHELVDQFEDDDILRMVDITLRFKKQI